MKKQKIALVLSLFIAGCSSDQGEQQPLSRAQSALTPRTIYDNGVIAAGWTKWFTASSYNLKSTVRYNGAYTLSATYKSGQWTAFTSSSNISGYTGISFMVNAGLNTVSPGIWMELRSGGNWYVSTPIATYCNGGSLPKNTWVSCYVPLTAFDSSFSSSTLFDGVSFDSGAAWKTLYLANIQLVDNSPQGAGGASSVGGTSSIGGSTSVAGGSSVIGGSTSSGGSTTATTSTVAGGEASIGGSSASGGVSSIGGSNALGGDTSSGGSTTVSGGTSSIGGSSTSVGGTTSEGGSVSLGGTSSAGGSSEIGGTSSIGGSSSAGGGTSLGCSVTGQQTGEFHLSVKDGVGTDRDFLVIVPTLYVPSIPRSLLFGFHGAGGTYDTPRYYGFLEVPDVVADTIYIFPQGVPYRDYGVGWNDACDGYDMIFFDNMLAKIESLYCIDTKRVYAVGFSWGCDFVTGLACCRGDKIRGIGAASCSDDFSRSGDFTSYLYLPCPAVNHAGIRFTHDLNGDWGYSADEMTMTSHLYRYLNRCSGNSSAISTECVSYQDCAEPVVECDYLGLGHWMPPNWAQDTWNFFKQLP